MCAAPANSPVIGGEASAIILVALLALTNAFFSTISMQIGGQTHMQF